MINYKNFTVRNLRQYSFFERIKQNLPDCFEEIDIDPKLELFSEPEFCQILFSSSEAFKSGNLNQIISLLLVLLDQFSIPNKEIQHRRCRLFQQSEFCSILMSIIDNCHFYVLSPYILQLFINILAVEDENHDFAKLNINNNGIEVVMHLKKVLSEDDLPLIFLYAYNIYSEASRYIVTETTELYFYSKSCENLHNSDNSSNYFLIPLAIINILRNEEVDKAHLPDFFFENIIPIAQNPNPQISIFSMWCLYFYFKNSYMHAGNYINSDLLNLLESKILSFADLTETKISLYILSFCLMVEDRKKKFKCIKKINKIINRVIELMMADEKEISTLAIALCNNYAISHLSNLLFLIQNNVFGIACEIAKNGPLSCKIEAGMLMITLISKSSIEDQSKLLTPVTLSIICDLLQVNNNEVTCNVCMFITHLLPCHEWVTPYLLSENFDVTLYSLQESSDNQFYISLTNNLLKPLIYKRNKLNSQ